MGGRWEKRDSLRRNVKGLNCWSRNNRDKIVVENDLKILEGENKTDFLPLKTNQLNSQARSQSRSTRDWDRVSCFVFYLAQSTVYIAKLWSLLSVSFCESVLTNSNSQGRGGMRSNCQWNSTAPTSKRIDQEWEKRVAYYVRCVYLGIYTNHEPANEDFRPLPIHTAGQQ